MSYPYTIHPKYKEQVLPFVLIYQYVYTYRMLQVRQSFFNELFGQCCVNKLMLTEVQIQCTCMYLSIIQMNS